MEANISSKRLLRKAYCVFVASNCLARTVLVCMLHHNGSEIERLKGELVLPRDTVWPSDAIIALTLSLHVNLRAVSGTFLITLAPLPLK